MITAAYGRIKEIGVPVVRERTERRRRGIGHRRQGHRGGTPARGTDGELEFTAAR